MRAPVAAVAAGAGAALLAVWLVVPVPVTRVEVTGNRRMARGEIARLSGVRPPARLTYAQARAAARRMASGPEFESVRIARGFTGTLHLGVSERAPVAWMPRSGCAVARDGRLLPHFSRREAGWIALEGLPVAKGGVEAAAVVDALALAELLGAGAALPGGTLRRWVGGWEWDLGSRRIRCSAPARRGEIDRLRRFQAAFPHAWESAGRVDVRFAERVVVASR